MTFSRPQVTCLELHAVVLKQVALKALQRHHRHAASDNSDKAEAARLKGALQQSSEDYQLLLEQFYRLKAEQAAASHGSYHMKQHVSDLQQANVALHRQLQQSQEQLQQLQEQLQRHRQEADKAQKLLEQLSKAAADIHAVAEQQTQRAVSSAPRGFSARHNLQAVHDEVQNRMARYDSQGGESGQSEDDSNELILPALWKPQKERYLAPTGFR